MIQLVQRVEQIIVRVLILLLLIATLLGTFALGRVLVLEIAAPPAWLIDPRSLFEAFGLFVVILIGLELLRSMILFVREERIQPAIVVEVAIIALCNKVITLDLSKTNGLTLLGIAGVLVGLGATYLALRHLEQARAEAET